MMLSKSWIVWLFQIICLFRLSTSTIQAQHRKQQRRQHERHILLDNVEVFLSDLEKLDSLENTTQVLTKSHSKTDSSYTKSWTDADWNLHQIKSFRRYARHMGSWLGSPTFRSVLPAVAASVTWSILCILAVSKFRFIQEFVDKAPFSISISPFASPISILLALKTNQALNRLIEARVMFGIMIRAAASLAGLIVTYIVPINEYEGLLMGRHLAAFGWCFKGKLRGEDDTVVLQTLLPPSEAAWVKNCDDSPSAIVFRLRSVVGTLTNSGQLPVAASQVMEERLGELERAMGTIVRIIASPIPPTFTRMTSRVLCLFLFLLPLALKSSPGTKSPIAIVVIVTFLSYIFVGIDEIGVEVEYPVPLLPMFSLSKNLEHKVGDQFAMFKNFQMMDVTRNSRNTGPLRLEAQSQTWNKTYKAIK